MREREELGSGIGVVDGMEEEKGREERRGQRWSSRGREQRWRRRRRR
jgi:hypothetical protein